jgi:hypothetical protein
MHPILLNIGKQIGKELLQQAAEKGFEKAKEKWEEKKQADSTRSALINDYSVQTNIRARREMDDNSEGLMSNSPLEATMHAFGEMGSRNYDKARECLTNSLQKPGYTKESVIKEFGQYCAVRLDDNANIYAFSNVPEKKIKNAADTFLKPFLVSGEPVQIFFDDTLLGGGKEGFALGTKRMAWYSWPDKTVVKPLSSFEFKRISLDDYKVVLANKSYFTMTQVEAPIRLQFIDILKLIHEVSCL